jgi:hypothetical protein
MKSFITTLVLAMALAGSVQAATTHNGGLPSWADKAFEVKN